MKEAVVNAEEPKVHTEGTTMTQGKEEENHAKIVVEEHRKEEHRITEGTTTTGSGCNVCAMDHLI